MLSTSQQRALEGEHNVKGMLRRLLFTTQLVKAGRCGRCVLGGEAGGVWAGGEVAPSALGALLPGTDAGTELHGGVQT